MLYPAMFTCDLDSFLIIWWKIPKWVHYAIQCHLYFQGAITNILEENVLQPLLVTTSAITLASETVRSILKIDDIVSNLV